MEESLKNTLILEKILTYLNVRDLKNCSLINPQWYTESQKLIRKRTNVVVSCEQISRYLEPQKNSALPIKNLEKNIILDTFGIHESKACKKNRDAILKAIEGISESIHTIKIHVDEDSPGWESRLGDYSRLFTSAQNVSSLILNIFFSAPHSPVFLRFLETIPGLNFPSLSNLTFSANWLDRRDNRIFGPVSAKLIAAMPNLTTLDLRGLSNGSTMFISSLGKVTGNIEQLTELVIDIVDGYSRSIAANIFIEANYLSLEKIDFGFGNKSVPSIIAILRMCRASLRELVLRFQGKKKEDEINQNLVLPELPRLRKLEICLKYYGNILEPPLLTFPAVDGIANMPRIRAVTISSVNEPLFKAFCSQTFQSITFPQINNFKYEYLDRSKEPSSMAVFIRAFPNASAQEYGLLKRGVLKKGISTCSVA